MYESLIDHTSDFHLCIFAFDDFTYDILKKLNLSKVTVVSLEEFETAELKKVKEDRSKAEYCWTCTPSVILYVLENYKVPDCTYIDSDLFFYSDPSLLILEMVEHNKGVMITEHRFSFLPGLYEKNRAGRFCVQFMTFLNQDKSLKVLDKWRRQCITWCYARHEDGKFGDQKYLEEWPTTYDNIHILQHQGGGVAPWNHSQYCFNIVGNLLNGRVKKTGYDFKVVFFHFQYVKFIGNGTFDVGWYILPSLVKKLFYTPYLMKIIEIENRLQDMNIKYTIGFTSFKTDNFRNIFKIAFKKISGYNIMKIKQ